MATKAQVQNFISMIAPIAQAKAKNRSKWSLPSVCIAQACCESAYGTSTKMIRANALFGIKVGNSKYHFGNAWKDKAYSTKTKECYDGKTYVNIVDMFRAYDSIPDAVEDYYDMLSTCSRYKGCLNQSDPWKCITAIKQGGYATSPTYVASIMSIINKYNLTQYDGVVTGNSSVVVSNTNAYIIGKNYTLQNNMFVRDAANGNKKLYDSLTVNARIHANKNVDGHGVLKKGTVVTCKSTKKVDNAVWMEIPSGWVCAISSTGKVYVK